MAPSCLPPLLNTRPEKLCAMSCVIGQKLVGMFYAECNVDVGISLKLVLKLDTPPASAGGVNTFVNYLRAFRLQKNVV